MAVESQSLFEPEKNCWRIETASHAAMIVDAEDYYRALYEGICRAKHSIFIFGWDVDGRIPLIRDEEIYGDCPVILHDLIVNKARENPHLEIYINQWDHPLIMAIDREVLPAARWRLENCPNIHFRFDKIVPLQASQHQKIVVIDDEIAYSGGQDVGPIRWDNRAHSPDDERRKDFESDKDEEPYQPNHDIQILVSGPAAQAVAELARRRWFLSADYEAVPIRPYNVSGLPGAWPSQNPPQFENVPVAIALTFPSMGDNPAIRQIESAYFDQIETAERFIYIENQYLASNPIARALNAQLKKNPNLRILIFSSSEPQSLIEEVTMWTRRIKFNHLLKRGNVRDRVEMTYGISVGRKKIESIHVHSKIMIVDDRFLQVGSANINDRSMNLDSECDLIVIGDNDSARERIADLRNDLISEHSGMEKADIQSLIDNGNPIGDFLKDVPGSPRHLRRIRDNISTVARVLKTITFATTHNRPISNLILNYFSHYEDKAGFPHKRVSMAFLIIMLVMMILLFWNDTPAADVMTGESLKSYIGHLQNSPYAVPLVIGLFIVGGLFFAPVTVMIAGTAATFGPMMGMILALTGAMASALVTFLIGALLGKKLFQNYTNTAFMRISDRLKNTGLLGIAAIRMVPIAPFTLVNMILGVTTKVKLVPYLVGTFLGILPGTAAMVLLGDSLGTIWRHPEPINLLYIGFALLVWLGVLVGIHILLKSRGPRQEKEYV